MSNNHLYFAFVLIRPLLLCSIWEIVIDIDALNHYGVIWPLKRGYYRYIGSTFPYVLDSVNDALDWQTLRNDIVSLWSLLPAGFQS